jgi:hypothetical protein
MATLETYIETCNRFRHIHPVVCEIDIPDFSGFSKLCTAVGVQFFMAIIRDFVYIDL